MGVARSGWGSVAFPAGLVLAGAVSVQVGAGIATRLFGQLPPAAVTTLRLWSAALILLAIGGRDASRVLTGLARRGQWRDAVITAAFGVALGFMNYSIYQAFATIPLGIAVTIEFLGPLAVTITGSIAATSGPRRTVNLACAALAAGGVLLLAHGASGRLRLAGVAWAVAAGTAWAGYILASKATGARLPGSSGLVIAMCVAAFAVSVPGVLAGGQRMFRPGLLATGAIVGLLSSVIPYRLELEALRRIPARLFGVWMSAQPAVAALAGLAILGQRLSAADWGGICCVAIASAAAAGIAREGAAEAAGDGALTVRPAPFPEVADGETSKPPNTAVRGALRWAACFLVSLSAFDD